jgi:hypothetical protein
MAINGNWCLASRSETLEQRSDWRLAGLSGSQTAGMLEDIAREFPPGPMVVIIRFNPKFEVASKVRKFGTTEALRTTEKTEF